MVIYWLSLIILSDLAVVSNTQATTTTTTNAPTTTTTAAGTTTTNTMGPTTTTTTGPTTTTTTGSTTTTTAGMTTTTTMSGTTTTTAGGMTTTTTPCCGIWSSWSVTSPCNDMCGSCGNWTRTRTCTTASTCPCTGPSTLTSNCNDFPCPYPRNSCCSPYAAMSDGNGEIICGSTTTPPPTTSCPGTCCPTGGMWSSWTLEGSCNDTCGGYGYGNYRRICLTGPSCPCIGSNFKSDHCNFAPCAYPRNSCVNPYTAQDMNGQILCAPNSTMTTTAPPPASCCPQGGLWNPWGPWSSCSDTCGGCGTTTRTRTCGSASYGCPCNSTTGSTSETLNCNKQVCPYPRATCCSPYRPMDVSGQILCWN